MEYKFDESNFETEVLNSDKPVLVDVFATWCGPCKMLAPVIEEIAKEYDGRAKVGKVNSDENQSLAVKYGVQFLPTLLFFKGGKVANTLIGMQNKDDIKSALDALL